ncbi:MAG: hypothetical protein ABI728_15245, partial [Betaproteobacteria bacterium]
RHLDIATIYWVLPILIVYAAHGVWVYKPSGASWTRATVIGVVTFIVALGTALPFFTKADSTWVTLLLILILLIFVAGVMFRMKLVHPFYDIDKAAYVTVLGLLLVSCVVFRFYDGQGTFLTIPKRCSPDSAVQFHALWHVVSAVTLLVGYNLFSRAFDDEGTIIPDLNEQHLK